MLLRGFLNIKGPSKYIAVRGVHVSSVLQHISCWRCDSPHEDVSLHCSKCHATLDPTKPNYFEFFGIPINYDVNTTDVVASYHKLQVQFHPDKHSNDTEAIQEISKNFSVLATKAYKTLINPVDRGVYLLSLLNYSLDTKSTNDKELLVDILKIDDDISTMSSKGTAAKIKKKISNELEKLKKELSHAFKRKDYDQAGKLVVKMRFYHNLMTKLKNRTSRLVFS